MNFKQKTNFEADNYVSENPILFWKQQFDVSTSCLKLLVDFNKPSTTSYRINHVFFSFPASGFTALKQLSDQQNTSLYNILLASYNTLLFRYTRQEDIVIGLPTPDNNFNENGELTGTRGNIKIFRTDLSGNPSFNALLKRVHQVLLLVNGYEDVSYGDLKKAIGAGSGDNDIKLYNVTFSYKNANYSDNEVNDGVIYNAVNKNAGDGIDLALSIKETMQGLKGTLTYNSELFEADTIKRLAKHFEVLLESIVANPEHTISELKLLTDEEKDQLISKWNNTKVSYPDDTCIHQLFEAQVLNAPAAIALIFEQKKLSYGELNKRANQLAFYLRSKGAKQETLVAICMGRSLEMIIGILGILKAGAAYVPIDPNNPIERIRYFLEDTKASFVVCTKGSKMQLKTFQNIELVELAGEESILKDLPVENLNIGLSSANLAYVIYTSGSTGTPKGVMIEHRSAVNYLLNNKTRFIDEQQPKNSGSFMQLSYTFDASLTPMFIPLLSGKLVVLSSKSTMDVFEDDNLLKYAPYDFLNITPSHLELLYSKLGNAGVGFLAKKLVIGGEALFASHFTPFIEKNIDVEIVNLYGPTEATIGCSTFSFHPLSADETLKRSIPIGKPIDNAQLYLLDSDQQLVPVGIPGDIYIGGAGVARGYLNRPELTAQKFISDPYSSEVGARLYMTGDLGRRLPDGNIEYIGRMDDQVKIRGYRIELGEIESVLKASEPVSNAVVLVKENNQGSKRLVSYYVPDWQFVKAAENKHYQQQVAAWKDVYEMEYEQTEGGIGIDEEFNIVGWDDSFTGKAIPEEQMREWLDDIVNLILSEKPGCVLEIGCGTGLIFYQLAGKVEKYIGTDLSRSSVNQIRSRINKGLRNYGPVELWTSPAHEVSLPDGEQVDTILLNSIVQHFPGEGYMDAVIARSLSLLNGSGRIIIGDVRDNRLLTMFKTRLWMPKLQSTASINDLKWAVDQAVLKEKELCLSPEYFYRLKSLYSQITYIDIEWKHSSHINELTMYRYNVVIYVGIEKPVINPNWQNWQDINKQNILDELIHGRQIIAIKDAPNPRLWKEKTLDNIFRQRTADSVGDLSELIENEDEETLSILEILSVAEVNGYECRLFLDENIFKVNILIEKTGNKIFVQSVYGENGNGQSDSYTNIPLFTEISAALKNDIRSFIQKFLPDYMIPQDFIAIRQMPLTNNGKIDRKALPEPEMTAIATEYIAPDNATEQTLAGIWQELFSLERIGTNDNFFELGGNSIDAVALFAKVKKEFRKNFPLATIITSPTIRQLAVALKITNRTPSRPLVPIQPNGSKTPLFCIHAGRGDVLFYYSLSQRLGLDQPLYGLQAKGIDGLEFPPSRLPEIACRYVSEIREVQPEGPYYLGGYCLGAELAFEMAQQLTSSGQNVALLANFNGISPTYGRVSNSIDSNSKPISSNPINSETKKISNKRLIRALNHINNIKALSLKEKFIYVYTRLKKQVIGKLLSPLFFLRFKLYGGIFKLCLRFKRKVPDAFAKIYLGQSLWLAQISYQVKTYPGTMVIFRSPGIFKDPYLGWKSFIKGGIKTIDIPGIHETRRDIMNEPYVQILARELENFLDKGAAAEDVNLHLAADTALN